MSSRLPAGLPQASFVVAADLDRDGDDDLAFGGYDGLLRTLRQTNGNYALDSRTIATFGSSPAVAFDANGDGAAELLLSTGRDVQLLQNDGTGSFAVSALPGLGRFSGLAVADTDRDGDLDVLASCTGGPTPLHHWENVNGRSFISRTANLPTPRTVDGEALAMLDVDRDGDLDVALAAGTFTSEVLLNVGGRFVRPAAPLVPPMNLVRNLLAADYDGDGQTDLLVQDGSRRPEIWKHTGSGLSAIDPTPVPEQTEHLADLNGDGDPDAIGIAVANGRSTLFTAHNDGSGRCAIAQQVDLPSAGGPSFVGDVDGDGDQDVLVVTTATSSQPAMWRRYLNDGRGVLSAGLAQIAVGNLGNGITMVDLDADRDDDLVLHDGFALESTPGGFVGHRLTSLTAPTALPIVVDLQQDGLPEVIYGEQTGIKVLANLGQFTFVDNSGMVLNQPVMPMILASGQDPAGRAAVLVVTPVMTAVHTYDGLNLASVASIATPAQGYGLARGVDLDGDGASEWLVIGSDPVASWSGTLSFTLQDQWFSLFAVTVPPYGAFADIDGDGDLDIATPRGTVWRGMARQAHAPLGATLGHEFRIDFTSRSGALPLALLAGTSVKLSTPWGLLRVDPNQMLVAPTFGGSLRLTLPNNNALRGLGLCAQGTELAFGAPQRFTNLERRVVR